MKVLAVCGFGVGSSMALKMQLEKTFKSFDVVATFDNTDTMSAPSMGADVIFTSPEFAVQLAGMVQCPIITIRQFMNATEVHDAVEAYLENLKK